MAETIHRRTCPLCEGMCGLRIHVEDGRVKKIRSDPDDVWSKGYMCPKGATIGDLYHDPDRLRKPLVKREGEFVEVSWPEAFKTCERLLHGVVSRDGQDAVTAFIGNPSAHNFSLSRYVGAFVAFSQIPRIYSSGTVDQWPKNLSSALMYGGMWTIPTVDIDRSDFLVIMGANPHASQGSLMCAPDFMGRMEAIHERGGKTLVIDPRRTGTADRATDWLPIQPGTDAALLLAVLNVVFAEGLDRLGELGPHVNGLERVRDLVVDWTPERVSATCRIPAEAIRDLARDFATTERAAWYARIGTCNQEFGSLASWLVDVLNIVTGHFDRPGGSMFAEPIAWSMVNLPNPEFADGFTFGRWKSRVSGAPEVFGQIPAGLLAEEIATPGEGQIKALITIAGNPVISAPGADALDAALPQLDCMISVDNYLNETTRHADVILPGLAALEQPHYDELMWGWAVRNCGRYSPVIFAPDEDQRDEWESLVTLAMLCAGQKADEIDAKAIDDLYFAGVVATVCGMEASPVWGRDPGEIVAQSTGERGPERLLEFAVRSGPYGDAYGANPDGLTLERLKAAESGVDMGPLGSCIPEILRTPSGKIELAPDYIVGDLGRLRARLGREDGLVLVSRRHVRSKNSWLHNIPALVSGKDRCTLLVHPDDAKRFGVDHGQLARVSSSIGAVEVSVDLTDEMMPGVVCLPHGWGHGREGTQMSVAAQHPGICNNVLAPADFVDAISGNAAVNGIPVQIGPVDR